MAASSPTEQLLTSRELARRLNMSTDSIYRLVASGKLVAIRLHEHGPLRFRAEDVEAMLSNGTRAA